jgi:hypothetical protein
MQFAMKNGNKELLGIDVNRTLEITKIYLEVKNCILSVFALFSFNLKYSMQFLQNARYTLIKKL